VQQQNSEFIDASNVEFAELREVCLPGLDFFQPEQHQILLLCSS
jgi:hypothetical protein